MENNIRHGILQFSPEFSDEPKWKHEFDQPNGLRNLQRVRLRIPAVSTWCPLDSHEA